jgi:hypothetical protein
MEFMLHNLYFCAFGILGEFPYILGGGVLVAELADQDADEVFFCGLVGPCGTVAAMAIVPVNTTPHNQLCKGQPRVVARESTMVSIVVGWAGRCAISLGGSCGTPW